MTVEGMKKNVAWNFASVSPRARRLAEEAAQREYVSVEEWLNQTIVGRAAGDIRGVAGNDIGSHAPLGRIWLDETEDLLEAAVARIERRLRRGEERLARAVDTMMGLLERTRGSFDPEAPSGCEHPVTADEEQASPTLPAEGAARDASLNPSPVERRDLRRRLDERLEQIGAPGEAAYSPNDPLRTNLEKRRLDLQSTILPMALHQGRPDAGEAHNASWAVGVRRDHEIWRESTGDQGLAGQITPVADDVADETPPSDYETSGKVATSPAPPLDGQSEDAIEPAESPDPRSEEANPRPCAVDLTALREDINAMNRSIAELAPRNAVVALEGAVRDLTERVALLRQGGEREALLAPLDAMAAELRASLKSRDPQSVAAALEREISALAGKIDALAASAISLESFDRIQRQIEEVRDLLASAVSRSAPLERLERQISELADRIEGLSASPAPYAESEQMVASLADLRGEVERSTPLSALAQIERHLEHIAARLDKDISAPPRQEVDPDALAYLANTIGGLRQSLEERLQPQPDTSALEAMLKELSGKIQNPNSEPPVVVAREMGDRFTAGGRKDTAAEPDAIGPMLAEIIDKLDRLPSSIADLPLVERLLQSLDAKLDVVARRPPGPEIVAQIADEVAERLEKELALRMDGRGLSEQIARINDRLEALSGLHETQELMRKLLVVSTRFAGGASSNDKIETPSPPVGASPTWPSASIISRIETLEPTDLSSAGGLRLSSPPLAPSNEDDAAKSHFDGDDVLLEPGAAPQRGREAREIGPKTNPSISAHIAAARRAANAAHSEAGVEAALNGAPGVARGVERAKSLYASHKRSVLLAAAFAVVAMAAARLIGAHLPVLQKSDLQGQPHKTAAASSMPVKPAIATLPTVPRIDTTPTASIAPPSEAARDNSSDRPPGPELSSTTAAALPTSLREAIAAGSPQAQYELAQRLFEGRGVPQDQPAAAAWFERAASSGLAPAQFRLGTIYNKGFGVQRDAAAAKRWYARAAEAGNARAAHNLAVMYAEPVNGTPDYAEAAKWFRKAAEFGVRDSQFNLAILYARGLGVDQDLRQSWLWFSLAAAQGDADAAKKRDEVAAKMDPAALAAAANDLAKFQPGKPDPAANEVASPPGGWDGKPGAPPPA